MKSMTGFAKTQFEIDNRTYSVEIKTLNSKQLDINTKLPTLFRDKDLEIRSLLNVLTRGKVEFLIAEDSDKSKNVSVLNFDVAKTHYAECLKLQQMLDVKANDLLSVVLSQSDVWEVAETKELAEEVWQTIVDNINSAIALVDEFRLHEGEILKKDFIHRINLIEDKLDKVYEDFLKLADKKKDITDDEILVLAGAGRNDNHHIKLEYLQVTSGVGVRSVASLGLNIAGEHFESAATGNGPVDAAIKALKKIIDRHMELKEFTIQAISKGSDDMGKVHMQVEYDGQMYYGFGANTDIIAASVEAYIDCINKFKR